MNKRFQFIMVLISALGFLILSLSHIFRDSLTEFTLGLCEGLSFVFIITWGIYMCCCFAKKKNPYKIS
ncbi:hypothetical protein [Clostridium senegalense]